MSIEERAECGEYHDLAVWFSPSALREHLIESDDPDLIARLERVTDDDLRVAAGDALMDDRIWELFGQLAGEILGEAGHAAQERVKSGEPTPPLICARCGQGHKTEDCLVGVDPLTGDRAAVGRCPVCHLKVVVDSAEPGQRAAAEEALRIALDNHAKTHTGGP